MEEVRRLRKEKGWNQNELAFHADLAPSVISLVETGKREPNAATLRKLATALGVEIPELFRGANLVGKADAPPSPEPEGFSEEERRYLTLLMDSYAGYFSDLSKRNGPRIANLPQNLLPEDSLRVYQWVAEFMADCDLLEERLEQSGVMYAVIPLIDRATDGAYVDPELLQKARGFQRAWVELFVGVWTTANGWVESQRRRPEVMEFSNNERLAREPDSTSVTYLPDYKRRKKRTGFPHAVAEAAG